MSMQYVYEPQYFLSGWFDDSGQTLPSWFDRDLVTTNGQVIFLAVFEPGLFLDADTIFLLDGSPGTPMPQLPPGFPPTAGVWVQVYHPKIFLDPDQLFQPHAVRALDKPDKGLKNEIRRLR